MKHLRVYLLIIFGVLTLMTFLAPVKAVPEFLAPYNIYRLIIMAIFLFLLLSSKDLFQLKKPKSISSGKIFRQDLFISFKNSVKKMPRSAKILAVVVPLIVLVAVMVQALWPEFAAWLIRCDNKSECGLNFRHGIFVKTGFQLVAAIIFAVLLYKFARKKQWWQAAASLLLVMVLVLMMGEELSWGQRIFGWETPADYAQINKQGETNLHNLNTNLFQNVLYFGVWLLMIALPLFRDNIKKLLAKFKPIAFVGDWLPPAYFILIFAAMFGLVDPMIAPATGMRFGSILFTILATAAILTYLIVPARGRLAERICWTFGIFALALFFNLFVSLMWDVNAGTPTEYHEVFLSFGIMWWAIDLKMRLKSLQQIPAKQ